MKQSDIAALNELRRMGLSYPEISQRLLIPKTTVYKYTKNVKILPEYIGLWKSKRGGSSLRKLKKEKEAEINARETVGTLTNKEKLLFLSALYWAEGSKQDFGLSNTDPNLIKVFISGLKEILKVKTKDLRISVRLYEDLDVEKALLYWSKIVGINKDNFCSVNIIKGKKKGKLEFGMCRVRIKKGGDLLKKIKAINNKVLENMSP